MKSLHEILGIHKSTGGNGVNVDNSYKNDMSVLKGMFKMTEGSLLDGRALLLMKMANSSWIGRKT